jgi:tetratricopeptide (TPR) repeat protein
MKKGEKALAIGEYYDASVYFKRAYASTSAKERDLRGKRAGRMAYAYHKMGSTQKAIAAYRNQIRYKQDSLPTHLDYARLLLKNGNYKEAAEEFQAILDSTPNNQLARDGLKSALTAPQIKQQGSRYTVKKMDIFNSRRSDFSPMLCGDEHDQLFFTSTRNEAQGDELSGITGTKAGDIFYAQKDDKGKWGKVQTI